VVHVEWWREQLAQQQALILDVIRLLYAHVCQHVRRVDLHEWTKQATPRWLHQCKRVG
jgi:hypothetical protein